MANTFMNTCPMTNARSNIYFSIIIKMRQFILVYHFYQHISQMYLLSSARYGKKVSKTKSLQ